jgi:hypothetical protein
MRLASRCALLLLLWLDVASVQAAVRAVLDTTTVAADGTVQLTLEHDGQTNDLPDLGALKQDFDVVSTSRGSSVQIINGSMSSHVRLELLLSPKHSGVIRIAPIAWGNEHSDALTVNVGGGNGGSAGGASAAGAGSGNAPSAGSTSSSGKVFMETSVDTRQPYVQAGVQMTVRLFAAVPLYHADLDVPSSSDVLVQRIGSDHTETQIKNGERYQVIERQYELFPQHSGPITLPSPVLNAQIPVEVRSNALGDPFRDLFGNLPFNNLMMSTKQIRVNGDAIQVNVLPRPAADNNAYWLPARNVSIKADWHPQEGRAAVGDPITVDLHLTAQGLTAAQLPDLNALLKLPPGLKAYPDQAKLENTTEANALVGKRDQSIALIADQPGEFKVPDLTIEWWDTATNQARELTVPGRTLHIAPAASSGAAPSPIAVPPMAGPVAGADVSPPPAQSTPAAPWRWISLALGGIWIATLVAWFFSARGRAPQPTAKERPASEGARLSVAEARANFQAACRNSDARAARASLIAWIDAARPDLAPTGLRAFARQADDAELAALLLDLDRACYGGAAWQGDKLLASLGELPPAPHPLKSRDALASLYP